MRRLAAVAMATIMAASCGPAPSSSRSESQIAADNAQAEATAALEEAEDAAAAAEAALADAAADRAPEPRAESSLPEGFQPYYAQTGQRMAVQWATPTASDCSFHDWCFVMWLIPQEDCPRSLYAAVTLLDGSGANVGWTNDTAQGARAGERVKLVFGTSMRNTQARLAEVSCY